MNITTIKQTLTSLMAMLILFSMGCKTVVRENIVSSINTGIGATITENPKTELYEVKLGFIRTQFYSIPTGKTVEGTNQSNAADVTPEVVSGIRAHSGAEHLFIGMDVSESFAVGKIAVASDAATAMYIANAKTDKAAAEAAKAVNPVARERAKTLIKTQDLAADEVIKKIYPTSDQPDKDQLKKAITGTALEEQFEPISKLNKTQFNKKLHSAWSDLAIEMKDNLSK
jgi:hypothetical protein